MKAERSYPRVTRNWRNAPVACSDDEWLSQPEAAKLLGVSTGRVVWRLMCEHLVPAHDGRGRAGVTRESVERDLEWLAQATWRARIRRSVKGLVRWI
ncbi:DNA-binding protein [Streptomyces formicae]